MSSPSTASTCVDDEARSSPGTARAGSTQQPGGAAASAPKAGSPLSQQRQAGLKTIAEGVGGGVREVSPPAFARGGSAHRISAGILGSPYHAAAAAPYNRSLMGRHVAGGVETEVTVQMVRATGGTLYLQCTLEPTPAEEDTIGSSQVLVTVKDVTQVEMDKALVCKRYDMSYNSKASDEEMALVLSPDLVFNQAGTQLPMSKDTSSSSGFECYLDRRRLFLRAFPDIHFKVLEQNVKEDRENMEARQVFTSWQWTATHTGPYHMKMYDGSYADIQPTGNKVQVHGIAIDVCARGRIQDHSAFYDEAALRMQLGVDRPTEEETRMPTVQLLLYQQDGRVKAVVRSSLAGSPRIGVRETEAAAHMQQVYCRKFLGALGALGGDGFCLCSASSPNLPLLLCTPSFAMSLGAEPNELPGSSVTDLLAQVFDASTPQLSPAIAKAVGSGEPLQMVVTGARSDGQLVGCVISMARLTSDGRSYWSIMLCDLGVEHLEASAATQTAGAKAGLGGTFIHRLPRSWFWFGDKYLESTLSDALHALEVSCTLVDLDGVDSPMVWLTNGFERMTGFSRADSNGRNCRFLQSLASDPMAVINMREAIRHGERVRVHLRNNTQKGEGFWCVVSLHPLPNMTGTLKYYAGVQLKLNSTEMFEVCKVQRKLQEAEAAEAAEAAGFPGEGDERSRKMALSVSSEFSRTPAARCATTGAGGGVSDGLIDAGEAAGFAGDTCPVARGSAASVAEVVTGGGVSTAASS